MVDLGQKKVELSAFFYAPLFRIPHLPAQFYCTKKPPRVLDGFVFTQILLLTYALGSNYSPYPNRSH